MRKLFLAVIIVSSILFCPSIAKAEATSIVLSPIINIAELKGTDVGNVPSFEIKFDLTTDASNLPSNAVIQSATIKYVQVGVSGGLIRIIDKYSADVIDSKSMSASGQYEINNILPYVRKWLVSPSQNLGLLFQTSSLAASDSITIGQIEIDIEFTIPDTNPPSLDGDIQVEAGSNTAFITFLTNEPTIVSLNYGRTANYGLKYTTDNSEATAVHAIALSDLASGSMYHYKITYKDESNNSASTLDLTFETLTDFVASETRPVDQSLKAPQELIVETVYTYGKPQSSLSWNPSNEINIKGYIVYRADTTSKAFVEYAVLDKSNNYLDTKVELGKTYYYYVRSYSDVVISPKSEEKSVIFASTVPSSNQEQPATLQTFLIVLAAASLVIFVFYNLIKLVQKEQDRQSKRLKNVLKDPKHYLERT